MSQYDLNTINSLKYSNVRISCLLPARSADFFESQKNHGNGAEVTWQHLNDVNLCRTDKVGIDPLYAGFIQ